MVFAKANCTFEMSSVAQLGITVTQLYTLLNCAPTKHAVALTHVYKPKHDGVLCIFMFTQGHFLISCVTATESCVKLH